MAKEGEFTLGAPATKLREAARLRARNDFVAAGGTWEDAKLREGGS